MEYFKGGFPSPWALVPYQTPTMKIKEGTVLLSVFNFIIIHLELYKELTFIFRDSSFMYVWMYHLDRIRTTIVLVGQSIS